MNTFGHQMTCEQRVIIVGLDSQAKVVSIGELLTPKAPTDQDITQAMLRLTKAKENQDQMKLVQDGYDRYEEMLLDAMARLNSLLMSKVDWQQPLLDHLDKMEESLAADITAADLSFKQASLSLAEMLVAAKSAA